DTVAVSSQRNLVQLGGLLTIDTGAGADTVTVDDSARTTPTDTTITGSTITGLPPTVDEEQTFTIRAASGTYTLLLPGALPGQTSIQLDYVADDAASIQSRLRTAYGFGDIDVAGTSTPTRKTFTVTFTGTHSGVNVGQITWVGIWTLTTPTGPSGYPLTLGDPNYGFATLQAPADSAGMTAALQAIYKTSDVSAVQTSPGVYTVTFTGDHAGLDFSRISGGTATAVTLLKPQPHASADVRTSTVHDGTTAPDRDVVQTINLSNATGGSYVLHFVLPNSQGELQDVATGAIAVSASAGDVLSALSAALNPNNVNPALPFTDNVGVVKHGPSLPTPVRGP